MNRCAHLIGFILILSSVHAFIPHFVYGAEFTIPPNDGFVTDSAGILNEEEEARLEEILRAYQEETTNEIAVLIVDSLQGEPIEEQAVTVGRAWEVGGKENDNGIVIFVSLLDRQMFLATGYGLEGAVPDIVAKGIIEKDIVPFFREGDYAMGLEAGIGALQKHIGGEYSVERYRGVAAVNPAFASFFFFLFIPFLWLLSVMARTTSWWLGGVVGGGVGVVFVVLFGWWFGIPLLVGIGLLLDFVVSRGVRRRGVIPWWAGGMWGPTPHRRRDLPAGRHGWPSDRFGGGGFGGFGGGSFGGGGAGGRW